MQVDDRVLLPQLPDDHKQDSRGGNDRKGKDEVGFKPVVTLPLVENDLQATEAQRHHAESDVVDFGLAQLAPPEIGRILDQP